jgi:hypothetical protein
MEMSKLSEVKVGDKVSYEDVWNPRRRGTVVAIEASIAIEHDGTKITRRRDMRCLEFTIRWDEPVPSGTTEFATKEEESTSDMRQRGWRLVTESDSPLRPDARGPYTGVVCR